MTLGPLADVVPRRLRGVALMLAATALFASMQAAVRYAGQDLHPFEVAFFRNLFGLLVLLPLLVRAGPSVLRTARLPLHAARGTLQTGGMMMFFTALTLAPLAQNVALSFTAPLFATVLAILVLGERAGWRRWAALAAGFAGSWMVIRPGLESVSLGSLLVMGSSCSWAGSMILIKYLARTDSSLTITAWMGLFMAPLSLVPALFVWQWPGPDALALLVLIGACGSVGHLALAQAFREADVGTVMPLDFMRLIWASALGFVVFAEVPDAWTWLGGAVIFAATTYIALREARTAR